MQHRERIGAAIAALLICTASPATGQPGKTTLTHRIVDAETGKPVAGTMTAFMRHGGAVVADTAEAEEEGRLELAVPAAPDRIVVWADGYQPRNMESPAPGGDLALWALKERKIQVVDGCGQPVPNTRVRLGYTARAGAYVPEWNDTGLSDGVFETDADGWFEAVSVIPHSDMSPRIHLDGKDYAVEQITTAGTPANDPRHEPGEQPGMRATVRAECPAGRPGRAAPATPPPPATRESAIAEPRLGPLRPRPSADAAAR